MPAFQSAQNIYDFFAELSVKIMSNIIAGQYHNIRIQAVDTVDTMRQVLSTYRSAAVEVAYMCYSFAGKYIGQILYIQIYIYYFDPFMLAMIYIDRPGSAKTEFAEECSFYMPSALITKSLFC